ncbi:MAG: hypothetical protein ACHQF2_11100 [Flavobacteriales bacterium]
MRKWISMLYLYCCGYTLSAQHRNEATLGIGIPEFLNVGLRTQAHQYQFGISFGTLPGGLTNATYFTFSGDVRYHFLWKTEKSTLKKIYLNVGYTMLKLENNDFIATEDFLKLRIGKKFNVTTKFGFEIEGGMAILTRHVVKKQKSGKTYTIIPYTPCIGLTFFFALGG